MCAPAPAGRRTPPSRREWWSGSGRRAARSPRSTTGLPATEITDARYCYCLIDTHTHSLLHTHTLTHTHTHSLTHSHTHTHTHTHRQAPQRSHTLTHTHTQINTKPDTQKRKALVTVPQRVAMSKIS